MGGQPDIETLNVDIKEEPGRRGAKGAIQPGQTENPTAAEYLAGELACLANTPGGGALIVGLGDKGQRIGTELDGEWLRLRVYELTDRRLTANVRVVNFEDVRLLVLDVPEAIEPIQFHGKIRWRVADTCQDVDAATWVAGRLQRTGHDWSDQPSGYTVTNASAIAIELARRSLTAAGDPGSDELAAVSPTDLLSRLHLVTGDGTLTNAGALLFVSTPSPAIDYIHRDFPGGDSTQRALQPGSLLEQLHAIESVITGLNRIDHRPTGFATTQQRALPAAAVRESIVNGITHRDWASSAPTTVEHVGDTLVVTSPGGFIGGIAPTNIITHPSAPRYRALASAMARLRLAEREGVGVDRMVRDMIAAGHQPPGIAEIPGPYVRTVLVGGSPDHEWIDFLTELEPATTIRDVEMLMLLRHLVDHAWIDVAIAAPLLQRTPPEATAALARLASVAWHSDPIVTVVAGGSSDSDPALRFSNTARTRLGEQAGRAVAPTARHRVVLSWAAKRLHASSTEIADLLGLSTVSAGQLLASLADDGLLRPNRENRKGRGLYYRPPSL